MFILLGVAIGVGVIVFMSALLSGLQANFVQRVLTGQSHIQLTPRKEVTRPLRDASTDTLFERHVQPPLQRLRNLNAWMSLQQQLLTFPQVDRVAPVVSGSALVARGEATRSISILGVDPASYFQIVSIPDKMTQGHAHLGVQDILIGLDLAQDLGVGLGDKLRLSTSQGGTQVFAVVGIFDLGNKSANLRVTYIALRTAQSLLGQLSGVSSLEVTVKEVYEAERIARRLSGLLDVQADSWISTNEHFFTALSAQTTANTTIRIFVALSVAFGMASVLVVSVIQKSREIGILRAMGVTRGQVMRVFLLEGLLLGGLGALGGSVLAYGALQWWQQTQRHPDGTPLVVLSFEPLIWLSAFVLATLTGVVSAWLPAYRASRLDPVEAIRG
jgi:lipoprotein-releasing system permease protein